MDTKESPSTSSLTYEKKLEIENSYNGSIVIFRKSGTFYEVLNYSAYLFYWMVAKYQINVEPIKKLNNTIIYKLGFPIQAEEKVFCTLNNIQGITVEDKKAFLVYSFPQELLPEERDSYDEWKVEMNRLAEERSLNKKTTKEVSSSHNQTNIVFDYINNIDYSILTPLKAMTIISELQAMVKENQQNNK